ncbi:MAG: hypothetical protein KatS3mg077_1597 [Candidatus Binatia bacterium]|nr:MAG: hypothetical protein KatS3mg077_1597 [Candidatus Binatia bacterium]
MATLAREEKAAVQLKQLAQLWSNVRLGWRLFFEPRVPWWAKAVLIGTLAYIGLPFDLLPDAVPVLGQVDDLLLLWLAWKLFLRWCPAEVVEEHARAVRELAVRPRR